MRVLVAIPALNEAETIGRVITEFKENFRSIVFSSDSESSELIADPGFNEFATWMGCEKTCKECSTVSENHCRPLSCESLRISGF